MPDSTGSRYRVATISLVDQFFQAAFGFDAATWYRLARNSFEASFATDEEKAGWIARLDAWFAEAGAAPA